MNKCFFYKTLMLMFLLLAGMWVFNVIIDPHGVNGTKMKTDGYEKIAKPFLVEAKQPEAIFIGNSRNFYGSDVSKLSKSSIYNFSLQGIDIEQILKLFEHALNVAPIKKAYITLDMPCGKGGLTTAIDPRFLVGTHPYAYVFLQKTLFNISYLSSAASIEYLRDGDRSNLDAYGRGIEFHEFGFNGKNYAHILKQREKTSIGSKNKGKEKREETYEQFTKRCDTSSLNKILELGLKRNIELVFFLNPVNVRYWEIAYQTNTQNDNINFQKLIVNTVREFANAHQTKEALVYNFRKINPITTERLSYKENLVPVYWFESSHYRSSTGDMMLNIFAGKNDGDLSYTILNSSDPETDTENEHKKFLEWRKNNPELVQEVVNLIKR